MGARRWAFGLVPLLLFFTSLSGPGAAVARGAEGCDPRWTIVPAPVTQRMGSVLEPVSTFRIRPRAGRWQVQVLSPRLALSPGCAEGCVSREAGAKQSPHPAACVAILTA